MRILMLTRFYLNGQTTHVFSLCSQLLKSGHQPFLVAANLNHPVYYQWLRNQQIPFSASADPAFVEQLMQKYDFELIHTHSFHTLELALDLGRRHQIPVAATCHYLDFQSLEKLAHADKIITISPEMAETLPLPPDKTVMIENGIDTAALKAARLPKEHTVPKAVVVTRMTDNKEPGYAILVIVLINRGWKVQSVGNWRPHYLGIPYTGWQVDLRSTYQTADLVIGTGRSIREGMAAGAAAFVLGDYLDGIVTETNVEVLRHYNFSGRAQKQIPTTQAIVDQIDCLTESNLSKLQVFSYQYAHQHFSQKKMTDAVVAVYQSLLG